MCHWRLVPIFRYAQSKEKVAESTKMWKCTANRIIVHIKTVGAFAKQRHQKPSLYNFCVLLAGHDLVSDTGTATTRSCNFKVSSLQKLGKIFCRITAGKMVFSFEIAAVNLSSRQKFYDNGAPAVLRRSMGVSAELPAILEK